MPGMEMYIPDYKEDLSQEEYERYEKVRPGQAKPERMTEEEAEDFFRDVPF